MLGGFQHAVSALHDARLTVDVTIDGVSFRLPNGTAVLTDVSATLPHGAVTALMGPSGCGEGTAAPTSATPAPTPTAHAWLAPRSDRPAPARPSLPDQARRR